jgi:glycosyltransferase involved in cell wall biosynthesis
MTILVPHGFEANYTVGFAKGLAENRVPLCVLSCDETAGRLSAAGIENSNIRGSQTGDRPALRKLLGLAGYYCRLVLFIARHRGATVHFTGIFRRELILFEGTVINACLKLLAGTYVYTAHNVLPHNRGHSRFFRWIYRIVYRLPDVIVIHTENGRRQLVERFGVPPEKIRVISIGLNEEIPMTSLSRPDARARLGFGVGEKPILFFGTIDEYKGLDLLIEAFDGLAAPEARLVVAGSFRSETCRRSILGMVAAARRRDHIRIDARLIPNEEVEVLFKGCDVLCLPYRNIYQSGLFFLGSRFGIPIVATNVGSLAEFVSPAAGLITRTNDAGGVRAALEEFLASSGRFNRNEIASAAEQYRWHRTCRAILPLYGPASGGHPGRGPRKA